MAFKPSQEHKALCRKVSKILKGYDRFFPWMWEYHREVTPSDVHATLGNVAMSVSVYDYIMQIELFVHPRALKLDDDELELTILHELGHVFFTDFNMVMFHLAGGGGPNWTKPGPWRDAEERACWRFARSVKQLRDLSRE